MGQQCFVILLKWHSNIQNHPLKMQSKNNCQMIKIVIYNSSKEI